MWQVVVREWKVLIGCGMVLLGCGMVLIRCKMVWGSLGCGYVIEEFNSQNSGLV